MALAICALILSLFPASLQSPSDPAGRSSEEVELLRLKRAMGEAYVKGDAAALERIYGDEYVVTDADGGKRTKAQEIADVKARSRTYESSTYDNAVVRVYGDAATVTGVGTVKGRGPSGPFHVRYHSTNVFVKRDGRWQAVAAHISGVERK